MAKQARIINGIATDVTEGVPGQLFYATLAAQFVSVPDQVEEGWIVVNGVWSAPAANPAPPPPPAWVNKYGFMQLFTAAERALYYQQQIAAQGLPASAFAAGATAEQQALAAFYDYLQQYGALPDPPGIYLGDPETIAALTQLFPALGIITAARAAQILANQPPSAA